MNNMKAAITRVLAYQQEAKKAAENIITLENAIVGQREIIQHANRALLPMFRIF